MTAPLDDVRPLGDLPPVVVVQVRWHWCGRLPRYPSRVTARRAAGPGPMIYRCPFARTGTSHRTHWHAATMTPDDLEVVAAVLRSPRATGPVEDPRPGRPGLWVVTDPATGRILDECPPPSPTPTPPPRSTG